MEILNPGDFTREFGLKTLERAVTKSNTHSSLKIGIPKEVSSDELRVTLTPGGVTVLVANGHEVIIEKNAGIDAKFTDAEYSDAGAHIAYSRENLFKEAEIITKVAAPTAAERKLMKEGQVLISALHLGDVKADFFADLTKKNITGIGFEFLQSQDGSYPIVRMMHEITGSMAVQIAAHYMESKNGGQGSLFGGISGVPPLTVVILGAGIIGEYAARTALGYGAQVFVMDNDLSALRRLENALDRRIITAMANQQYLSGALKSADVVIGAALTEGNRAPCWITEPMVAAMKSGSVIVDAVIDQGGCVSTSKPTTHSNPVFVAHDVIHYCVPNIPSSVARTATYALNNVMVPILMEIGDAGGIQNALWENATLRNGTYLYKRTITKKTLSVMFDLPFRDIDVLIASRM